MKADTEDLLELAAVVGNEAKVEADAGFGWNFVGKAGAEVSGEIVDVCDYVFSRFVIPDCIRVYE